MSGSIEDHSEVMGEEMNKEIKLSVAVDCLEIKCDNATRMLREIIATFTMERNLKFMKNCDNMKDAKTIIDFLVEFMDARKREFDNHSKISPEES